MNRNLNEGQEYKTGHVRVRVIAQGGRINERVKEGGEYG
jgi:hypothetical protein